MSEAESSKISVGRVLRGRRGPSPEFGLPKDCFCGHVAIVHTSRTTKNPGRRFYTCPMHELGGRHIWKWVDEAVMEEITIIRLEIQEQHESYETLLRRIGCGETFVVDPSGQIFAAQLSHVKEVLGANEKELAKMKDIISANEKELAQVKDVVPYVFINGFCAAAAAGIAVMYVFN